MGKLLKLKIFKNKTNGQVNISIPKKELDLKFREKLKHAKEFALISFKDFE